MSKEDELSKLGKEIEIDRTQLNAYSHCFEDMYEVIVQMSTVLDEKIARYMIIQKEIKASKKPSA